MTGPVLLDFTRVVARRWLGRTPSGIDRVSDAYASHLSDRSLAVIQVAGFPMALGPQATAALRTALDWPTWAFRAELVAILTGLRGGQLTADEMRGMVYVNVGHSGFDRPRHARWVRWHGLHPIYLLHDLIPLNQPHVTTQHKAMRHRGRVEHALSQASGLVVTTQAVAADLARHAEKNGVQVPPVLVAPIAGTQLPVPLHPARHDRALFVSIGTIEARKNHVHLLRVWSLLAERMGESTPQLVLAGAWGLHAGPVRAMLRADAHLRRRVEVRAGLDDVQLAQLLSGARGVLLPSLAEGFGLPLSEALSSGLPVIASDLPCFHEVGQGIPALLAPDDVAGWADLVQDFCHKGPEHQRQLGLLGSYRTPTWAGHFAAFNQWMDSLVPLADGRSPPVPADLPATHDAGRVPADRMSAVGGRIRDQGRQ
jgi:glycosyltransferase involved in cell wall biosynthesis